MKDNCKYCSGNGIDPLANLDEEDGICPVCLGWGYINYHAEPDQAPLSVKQTIAIAALACACLFLVLAMGSPA